MWFPANDAADTAKHESQRKATYEAQKKDILQGNPPRPERVEWERIITAAKAGGFKERAVNGRPRAIGHGMNGAIEKSAPRLIPYSGGLNIGFSMCAQEP